MFEIVVSGFPNSTRNQGTLVKRPNIIEYVRQILFFLGTLWTKSVSGNRDQLGAFSTRLANYHMQSFEKQPDSPEHFLKKYDQRITLISLQISFTQS